MKLKLIFLTLVAGMLLNPVANAQENLDGVYTCLLYTSPSPRD